MGEIVRDKKGRFMKGHSGNPEMKFKTRPENAGRKPSLFKRVLKEMKEKYGEAISPEEFNRGVRFILSMDRKQIRAIGQEENMPVSFLVIANGIIGDLENKQVGNLTRMADRAFGMPTQTTDITTGGQPIRSRLEALSDKELRDIIEGVRDAIREEDTAGEESDAE